MPRFVFAASPPAESQTNPVVSRDDALRRLDEEGFKQVSALTRDPRGHWIAEVRYGTRSMDVAVDQNGQVIAVQD